ncbi:hypothetical protein [Streptacidiphilus pinicola]|uniref:hypothetical protein n=1 Tax=Streptacidiphilus pinicola TaxID=2219663 RepID=UPI001402E935|nr:hypothetical protein [Streptacidiphilus pinicola]
MRSTASDPWEDARDAILRQVVERGWSAEREAFTHLALIDAALALDEELDRRRPGPSR